MEEMIKKNFSVYVGEFHTPSLGKLKELYQSDGEADAIHKAKTLRTEYDQIEVVNNATGKQVWCGIRKTNEFIFYIRNYKVANNSEIT